MVHLFDKWNKIEQKLKDKFLFIFLDFDGTLAPIAEAPDKAILAEEIRALLKRISDKPEVRLAFISGRALEDIKKKIGLKSVIYSGNHGLEIEGPKIKFKSMVAPRYRMILGRIKNDLQQKISSIRGAFVEDKGLSLSLHYRLVGKEKIAQIKTIFHEAVILFLESNKIKIKSGKMVLEVRPPVEWDKGKVVLWLLNRQIFASRRTNVLPIYIGDDATDEDAFKVLKNKGLTIFVGEPKETYARYYLRNPEEVKEFLTRVSEI
ncbi:MAG: trehalose-phosphatase [Candidatus Omnitrophota bacterium]